MTGTSAVRLEGLCGPSPGDWVRSGPRSGGIERIEAYFSGHAYDPHRHDTYAVGYTVTGVQAFEYRGARAASASGNAMVLHPDEVHNGRAAVEEGFLYRMLYIAPGAVRDALGERAAALPFVSSAVSTDERLVAAIRRAFEDFDRPPEPLESDQILLSVAEELLRLDPSAARARPLQPACAAAMKRVRSYLDANFRRVVHSSELESVAGLDRFALARQFRSGFGTSPYRYLTMRRLDAARAAIASGLPLADCAADSGFSDQSHMTRQFKRAYGMSPGRWRTICGAAARGAPAS